jgi:hypothetical protein
MFTTYHFDHREIDAVRVLDGWSYLWAALFGPGFVLIRGFIGLALLMCAISMAIVTGAVGAMIVCVATLDSISTNIAAALVVVTCAVMAQAVIAVGLVRIGYLRDGWREGY